MINNMAHSPDQSSQVAVLDYDPGFTTNYRLPGSVGQQLLAGDMATIESLLALSPDEDFKMLNPVTGERSEYEHIVDFEGVERGIGYVATIIGSSLENDDGYEPTKTACYIEVFYPKGPKPKTRFGAVLQRMLPWRSLNDPKIDVVVRQVFLPPEGSDTQWMIRDE
jgi:hypothetical protein